ncbi:archaeal/vacuolar-type H+-ATPase subunit D [Streptomyces noursei ATCC 11455]|uniref:V-type ATP synthase subunit D n=1 Tax=Streptomyces noursei TaxID=1971 RepID=UPI00081CA677|nr:archaeal/vacuolar-type H+-ATPase subunit D [Streptomyces noursei ATCC 11455]
MTASAPPPVGRAARLRLRRTLHVATRGAQLLDRQLHLLRAELAELRRAEAAARDEWEARVREARTWLLRGLLISGEDALRTASRVPPAHVTVAWEDSLGVRHPGRTAVYPGVTDASDAAPRNTALAHAGTSYRAAVEAAARYGTASTAARLVEARLRDTTVRVRALHRLRIPRLQQNLTAIELALEQSEHEDALRRRWAARRTRPAAGG